MNSDEEDFHTSRVLLEESQWTFNAEEKVQMELVNCRRSTNLPHLNMKRALSKRDFDPSPENS